MTAAMRTMRLFVNGKDAGPVEDVTYSFVGKHDSPPRGFGAGPSVTRIECSSMVPKGATSRALRRFIRDAARLATPYAKGRGLKKPRGRQAKALARERWLRETERRATERFRIEHIATMANALGVTPMLVAEDGRVSIVEARGTR